MINSRTLTDPNVLIGDLSVLINDIELSHGIEKVPEIVDVLYRQRFTRHPRCRVCNVAELSVRVSHFQLFFNDSFDERA